ncbi:hypothetical protein HMPREF1624_07720 [Sporothrix schenckii ATCC 58251]|uniref:Xylanolytic transcriptional activator regulatory domain-containing protein n=2 Tax=Sporothrix schenckii TaxID=29908 RepID=U7PL45_SPOS1|nr:hypothetical protein HMPREF1624_07720 [Sporothrix schenckii ATCC 58251]
MTEPGAAFQLRPTSIDYYLRLAEKRLNALNPDEAVSSPPESQTPVIGERTIQILSEARQRDCPGAALAAFSLDHWKSILQVWAEEVGLQYPFLDTETLALDIVGAFRESQTPGQNDTSPTSGYSATAGTPNTNHRRHVEDTAILLLVAVAILVDPTLVSTANPLAEVIYRDVLIRTHLADVDRDDVSLMTVAASYFYISGREVLAWRVISGVMRLLQEERVLQNYDDPEVSATASSAAAGDDRLYWSAFTMERRFSFSTGLPFAVRDSDIQHWPHFSDTSISTAYLKSMVDYCRISSEVRKLILLPAAPPAPFALTATRDFLDFRVVQWQKNLPSTLVFHGVRDTFDSSRECRGEYRLRLILYLRGSQMRTVIHRKSGLAALSSRTATTTTFDPASANTLALIAQDTIRILVTLARDTDIYHAQHKTFNHFLETALTSLLLCAGTAKSTAFLSFLPDVMDALALVERLSVQSPITKALAVKLKGVQGVVNACRLRMEQKQASAVAREGEENEVEFGGGPLTQNATLLPAEEYFLAPSGPERQPNIPEQKVLGLVHPTSLDPSVQVPLPSPVSDQRLSSDLGRFFPPDPLLQSVDDRGHDNTRTGAPTSDAAGMGLPSSLDVNSPMFELLSVGNILDDYENFAF